MVHIKKKKKKKGIAKEDGNQLKGLLLGHRWSHESNTTVSDYNTNIHIHQSAEI